MRTVSFYFVQLGSIKVAKLPQTFSTYLNEGRKAVHPW